MLTASKGVYLSNYNSTFGIAGLDIAYALALKPSRSDGTNDVSWAGQVTILSDVVGRASDLACTTDWQTLLTDTETVPAGRLSVIANIGYMVGATAGYAFEARLVIDGTEQRYRSVDLYHANCTDYIGMSFVVDIPAGARTWKIEVKKSNEAPVVYGGARSEMSWWLTT
jgi:hypothetical protein